VSTYGYAAGAPTIFFDPDGLLLRPLPPGLGPLLRPTPVRPKPTLPIDPDLLIPVPIPKPLEHGRGRYKCLVSCIIEEAGPVPDLALCAGNSGRHCPPTAPGLGYGKTKNEAWNNAKTAVDNVIPDGCYKRHCRGKAFDCKGWK